MLTTVLRLVLGHQLKPFVFEKSIDFLPDFDVPNLGAYVHIPFCETLCPFCPYYKVQYDNSLISRYIDALLDEITLVSERSFSEKREITSVYFGGGSPALAGDQLEKITTHLKKYYSVRGNMGIELHPRDISMETIGNVKNADFDMVSLGVQSFSPDLLRILGRTDEDPAAPLKTLSAEGFDAIDVDLIFGIPTQTAETLESDFLTAVENGATQISTYPFIDFSYADNKNKPLNGKEKKVLLDALLEVADKAGFERTSVWTFAGKDTPRYSSITRDNFIGFGSSATSLGLGDFKTNVFSVAEYIKSVKSGKVPTAHRMDFNTRTRGLYWLFWNSYNGDISAGAYSDLFGRSLVKDFGTSLLLGRTLGLLITDGNIWRLTAKGIYAFHIVEQIYTHQYIDKTWSIAMNDPWIDRILLY